MTAKLKRIKTTLKLIKKLKPFWAKLQKEQDIYFGKVYKIEKEMEKETGIKNIEFFRSPDDGYYCGIGNLDRSMKLIHDRQLE